MKAPVFVKVDKYREVEETIAHIKARIGEAKNILGKLYELKTEEEKELNTWEGEIKQIESKIMKVEQSMAR